MIGTRAANDTDDEAFLSAQRSCESNRPGKMNRDIVRLIVTLADSLRLKLVAGGGETTTDLDLLRMLGCEFGQGYLFSKPVDAKQAELLLRQQGLLASSAAEV